MACRDRAVVPWLSAAALGLLCGCGPTQLSPAAPRITSDVVAGQVFGLGEEIPVGASWEGSCAVTNRYDEVTGEAPCKERAFRVDLVCDGPCERKPRLAPLATGRFAFTMKLVATDGEESPVYRSPAVEVRMPDGLELYCYYPEFDAATDQARPPAALSRCDDRPLSAATPWIQVRARLGDRSYRTYAAALDGQRGLGWEYHETGERLELMTSLADLAPPPTTAVAPGRYEVTIELGDLATTVAVEVTP